MSKSKRWTTTEDEYVVSQVKVNPQNLSACFLAASKKLGRSKQACANRWYSSISKDKKYACFLTVSGKHKSLNRKNGKGEKSSANVFQRVLEFLGWSN